METMQTYTHNVRAEQADCDFHNQMMPAALLRKAQQIAIDHCNAVGLDDSVYQRTHTAFLMAKVALELYRPITCGERLEITTIPSLPQRAVCHRFTTFTDQSGSLAAACDSRWVLVDVNTRRILRHPPEEMGFPFHRPPEQSLNFSLPRIPTEMGTAVVAGYSLCDTNRHINNTRYADLACDAIAPEILEQSHVCRMVLQYHNEVAFGQTVSMAAASGENGYWYVQGTQSERLCMEAGIWLEPQSPIG